MKVCFCERDKNLRVLCQECNNAKEIILSTLNSDLKKRKGCLKREEMAEIILDYIRGWQMEYIKELEVKE